MNEEIKIFDWIQYGNPERLRNNLATGISPNITYVDINLFEFLINEISSVKDKKFVDDTFEIFKEYAVPFEINKPYINRADLFLSDKVSLANLKDIKHIYQDEFANERILEGLLHKESRVFSFGRNETNFALRLKKIKEFNFNINDGRKLFLSSDYQNTKNVAIPFIFKNKEVFSSLTINDIEMLKENGLKINELIIYLSLSNEKTPVSVIQYLLEHTDSLINFNENILVQITGKEIEVEEKANLLSLFFEKNTQKILTNSVILMIVDMETKTEKLKALQEYILSQKIFNMSEVLNIFIEDSANRIWSSYIRKSNKMLVEDYEDVFKKILEKQTKKLSFIFDIMVNRESDSLKKLDFHSLLSSLTKKDNDTPKEIKQEFVNTFLNVFEKKVLSKMDFSSDKFKKINRI